MLGKLNQMFFLFAMRVLKLLTDCLCCVVGHDTELLTYELKMDVINFCALVVASVKISDKEYFLKENIIQEGQTWHQYDLCDTFYSL